MKTTNKKSIILHLILYVSAMISLGFFCYGVTYAINTVATGYKVNNGQVVEINAHGVCKRVGNYTGQRIFVPTRTSTEWLFFRLRKPGGVGLTTCGCGIDYYKSGGSCIPVGTGYYSPDKNAARYACTNRPSTASYLSDGNGVNNCSWSSSRYLSYNGSGGSSWGHSVYISGRSIYGSVYVSVRTTRYNGYLSPSYVNNSYSSWYSNGTGRSYWYSSGFDKATPSRRYVEIINISRPGYTYIKLGHTANWSHGPTATKTHGYVSF